MGDTLILAKPRRSVYSGNATLSPLPLIESHEPSRAINPAQSAYPPDDDLTRLQVIAQCEIQGRQLLALDS